MLLLSLFPLVTNLHADHGAALEGRAPHACVARRSLLSSSKEANRDSLQNRHSTPQYLARGAYGRAGVVELRLRGGCYGSDEGREGGAGKRLLDHRQIEWPSSEVVRGGGQHCLRVCALCVCARSVESGANPVFFDRRRMTKCGNSFARLVAICFRLLAIPAVPRARRRSMLAMMER